MQHHPDDNDGEDGDHRRKINESGTRHDRPDRGDDRFGDLDQDLRDRILTATVEPRQDSPPDDGELHDQQECIQYLKDYQ